MWKFTRLYVRSRNYSPLIAFTVYLLRAWPLAPALCLSVQQSMSVWLFCPASVPGRRPAHVSGGQTHQWRLYWSTLLHEHLEKHPSVYTRYDTDVQISLQVRQTIQNPNFYIRLYFYLRSFKRLLHLIRENVSRPTLVLCEIVAARSVSEWIKFLLIIRFNFTIHTEA